MKKIIITFILILAIVLIILIGAIIRMSSSDTTTSNPLFSSEEEILNNSKWITLSSTDFNSLLLKSYSDNITSVITSLEKAVPVIIKVNGGQLCGTDKSNYIVASCFTSSNNVTIYIKNETSFTKRTVSLEELLEDAVEFLLLNDNSLEVVE